MGEFSRAAGAAWPRCTSIASEVAIMSPLAAPCCLLFGPRHAGCRSALSLSFQRARRAPARPGAEQRRSHTGNSQNTGIGGTTRQSPSSTSTEVRRRLPSSPIVPRIGLGSNLGVPEPVREPTAYGTSRRRVFMPNNPRSTLMRLMTNSTRPSVTMREPRTTTSSFNVIPASHCTTK
jgi:hypothetical protein